MLVVPSVARAHPVPRRSHDRAITVTLAADAVMVEYLLELDSWTLVFVDLPAVTEPAELARLGQPRDFYDAFTRLYASILAGNLDARLDGEALTFAPVARRHEEKDSIQCSFLFRAPWKPSPGVPHSFSFFEGNYETEPGRVKLTLAPAAGVAVTDLKAPDAALQARAETELAPGDEDRLRRVSARLTFPAPDEPSSGSTVPVPTAEPAQPESPTPVSTEGVSLGARLAALLDRPHGLVLALAAAFVWGASHALTPGHGKTLVAAYLVGQRGTAWHALFLGGVTTASHTGVLLALGLLFQVLPDRVAPLMGWLPAASGLMVAALGAWLFLCRLAGRADHVHLVGGHDHSHGHSHGGAGDVPAPSASPAGRYDEGHTPANPGGRESAGWMRLLVLGVSGGLLPCPAAVLLTVGVVNAHRLHLALPLLVAFSAGLALVLVALGLGVVYVRGFAAARWGGVRGRRWFKALPLVSAAVVTVLGLWLFRDALFALPPR